jgi:hypothetical protein
MTSVKDMINKWNQKSPANPLISPKLEPKPIQTSGKPVQDPAKPI